MSFEIVEADEAVGGFAVHRVSLAGQPDVVVAQASNREVLEWALDEIRKAYDEGWDDGREDGYQDGYEYAIDTGYDAGYQDGLARAEADDE